MSSSKPESISDYIAGYPPGIRRQLQSMRKAIREAAPGAVEKISYGMPTFALNGNLVHFAAYKSHIGFYPCPSGIEAFRKELSRFESSKGAVRFPLDEPLPLALVRKIVKYRVREQGLPAKKLRAKVTSKKSTR